MRFRLWWMPTSAMIITVAVGAGVVRADSADRAGSGWQGRPGPTDTVGDAHPSQPFTVGSSIPDPEGEDWPISVEGAQGAQPDPSMSPTGMAGMATTMRPDMAPPIGVMAAMSPKRNTLMVAADYMHMRMSGNRDGTHGVSRSDVLDEFPISPTDMDVSMLVGSATYGITDDISVMTMVPYIWKSMDLVTRAGGQFSTSSEGIGDVRVVGEYDLFQSSHHNVKITAGLSLPTGSTHKKDTTPAGPNTPLPYPMQLGSGTFDLLPGVTYTGQTEDWSWGGQLGASVRLGKNSDDYTLGNVYEASIWGARRWSDWVSSSVRLIGELVENIDGADPRLDPVLTPTNDPDLRAGRFISVGLGLNFMVPFGPLRGLAPSIEGVLPAYQNLDGPQLGRDYSLLIGLRKSF